MHILSGIVLSMLLKNRIDRKSPGKGFHNIIHLEHSLSGRVRYRIPAVKEAGKAELLAASLKKIKGIRSIEINPVSAGVLLSFDETVLTADLLTAVIIQLLGLDEELEKDPTPVVTRELKEIVRSLNRGVYDSSGGWLDLHTLVPVSLIALGLVQTVRERRFSTPTSLTLLWWAYQTFFVSGKRHD